MTNYAYQMKSDVETSNSYNSKQSIPKPSESESKTSDYINFPNESSSRHENLKAENTKSKQLTESANKIDATTESGVNQMNLMSQSANYANTLETSSEHQQQQQQQSDELYFRNYSNPSEIQRSSASYANEMISNRALVANYEYSAVRNYENAMSGLTTGTAFDRYDMNLSNLYASSLSMQRPTISYPSYLNSFTQDDPNNHQKYFNEHNVDSSTPYYPKPMYHYDSSFPLSGFSAMNLTLRSAAVANSLPLIDLSTPSIMPSSLSTHHTPNYSMAQSRTSDSQMSMEKEENTSNSSPQISSNDAANHRISVNSNNNNKHSSYQTSNQNENVQSYQASKSPQSEPVDLCNAPIKPTSTVFTSDNSMENSQNRPFSRSDSTSDSNASPYVDTFKSDPMSKLKQREEFLLCYLFHKYDAFFHF